MSTAYTTIPAAFTSPTVLVTVEDAKSYARDMAAGFDNLLLELRDRLADGLVGNMDLTPQQWQRVCQHIDREVAEARAAVKD